MRDALRRLPLERTVMVVVAATVFTFACASSSVPDVVSDTTALRWVMLALLGLLAVAVAFAAGGPIRLPASVLFTASLVVGLAIASERWSVVPHRTLGRSATLVVLFALVICLAQAAVTSRRLRTEILLGILLGACAVALAGLILTPVEPDWAIQRAFVGSVARYRGFGYNPDTAPMLYAVTLPVATWFLLGARSRRGTVLFGAGLVLIVGSTIASGSRGGLVAGFVGTLVVTALRASSARARTTFLAAATAIFVVGFFVGQSTKGLTPTTHAQPKDAKQLIVRPGAKRYRDAQSFFRLQDEIGRPATGRGRVVHTAFGSSGRIEVWRGVVRLALKRPTVGYGFGTQDRVFVDRYYSFLGGTPENSYVSQMLELGLVGLLALVAVLAACIVPAVRVLLRGLRSSPPELFACLGAVIAGLLLGFVQSYILSVGNVATLSFWLCAFLLPAIATAELAKRQSSARADELPASVRLEEDPRRVVAGVSQQHESGGPA